MIRPFKNYVHAKFRVDWCNNKEMCVCVFDRGTSSEIGSRGEHFLSAVELFLLSGFLRVSGVGERIGIYQKTRLFKIYPHAKSQFVPCNSKEVELEGWGLEGWGLKLKMIK